MHKMLDLIEHAIHRLFEYVQFVPSPERWQTPGQVSIDDGRSCLTDAVYLG